MDKRIQIGLIKAVPEFSDHVPTDSPFSFIASVREHMAGLVQQRLSYIQLDDAEPDRDTHIAYLRQYMKSNFSPFHDHLTLLVLADHNVRHKLYCLIFNELSDFGVNGFVGMKYYLSGPLFANTFFAPKFQVEQPQGTTYYNGRRKLLDTYPMPRFDHLPGVQVRIDKNRDARAGDIITAPMPYFGRMAITKEGRRYQKLVGGVTHTADGRPIDDDGNVGELE